MTCACMLACIRNACVCRCGYANDYIHAHECMPAIVISSSYRIHVPTLTVRPIANSHTPPSPAPSLLSSPHAKGPAPGPGVARRGTWGGEGRGGQGR